MFDDKSLRWARAAMSRINPMLVAPFTSVIEFLCDVPEAAARMRGRNAPAPGSQAYVERQAESFAATREVRRPSIPATVPDPMVSLIIGEFFGVEDTEEAKQSHLLSMAAENSIGELLERYLADQIEPLGWTWCSGSLVRAVDFIKPTNSSERWQLLQVKNRDNSENSSSSAIREGTTIEKWHRTFSRRAETNWLAFPDSRAVTRLSEKGFAEFVRDYLRRLPHDG